MYIKLNIEPTKQIKRGFYYVYSLSKYTTTEQVKHKKYEESKKKIKNMDKEYKKNVNFAIDVIFFLHSPIC